MEPIRGCEHQHATRQLRPNFFQISQGYLKEKNLKKTLSGHDVIF
jgi:hypothetical protein